jgi:4-hydroxybenzoate polyprenyltransferase
MNQNQPLYSRFWIYLTERFPLHSHGILIAAFSFSAIGYSRLCQQLPNFIDLKAFLVCIFNTVSLFFLLRVFDEHKDAEDDAKFRSELPVPRGLISLKELRNIGLTVFVFQLIISAVTFPKMLPLYAVVIAYLLLMGKEFFMADWLKKHQFWYVTSHMIIIPLIDIYASGYDWHLNQRPAPFGLIYFFGVSFFNGIVLELGRKIRAPHDEKPGVQTYSSMLGLYKSVYLWIAVLFATLVLALLAAEFAKLPMGVFAALCVYFVLTLLAAVWHLKKQSSASAKIIEIASGAWTILMYLTLGGILTITHIL